MEYGKRGSDGRFLEPLLFGQVHTNKKIDPESSALQLSESVWLQPRCIAAAFLDDKLASGTA
jgi:hypothetical protein